MKKRLTLHKRLSWTQITFRIKTLRKRYAYCEQENYLQFHSNTHWLLYFAGSTILDQISFCSLLWLQLRSIRPLSTHHYVDEPIRNNNFINWYWILLSKANCFLHHDALYGLFEYSSAIFKCSLLSSIFWLYHC